MIINKVHIEKFRGFSNSGFNLGKYVTLIAGQNGTQKSTLLGMLSQPFSITDKENVLHGEKPLSGDNFRSGFKDKFRLSPVFDQPKNHEWTLHLNNDNTPFTLESIRRDDENLRFWRKGDRSKGSGYIQKPVIYLSLKRLTPIGEEDNKKTNTSDTIKLTADEITWFTKHYKKIMINQNENLSSVDFVTSPNKDTLGVSTDTYDWNTNSAGQDNIGKILLAVLSFKRLKEKFNENYSGALLAIDEIDATLYPGSQVKLLEAFANNFCKDFNIQLIATTHSLQLLEKVAKLKKSRNNLYNTLYLIKEDGNVKIQDNLEFERIIHNLNISLGEPKKPIPKLPIYTEDPECIHFVKALLGRSISGIEYSGLKSGCSSYIHMASIKVPSFMFPNSIIVLDGDAAKSLRHKRLKNFICLPGQLSPERELATFLNNLPDGDDFWKSKNLDYSKQFCFSNYDLDEIMTDRNKAKNWYNQQLATKNWGLNASHLYKKYLATIPEQRKKFIEEFQKIHTIILTEQKKII